MSWLYASMKKPGCVFIFLGPEESTAGSSLLWPILALRLEGGSSYRNYCGGTAHAKEEAGVGGDSKP